MRAECVDLSFRRSASDTVEVIVGLYGLGCIGRWKAVPYFAMYLAEGEMRPLKLWVVSTWSYGILRRIKRSVWFIRDMSSSVVFAAMFLKVSMASFITAKIFSGVMFLKQSEELD